MNRMRLILLAAAILAAGRVAPQYPLSLGREPMGIPLQPLPGPYRIIIAVHVHESLS